MNLTYQELKDGNEKLGLYKAEWLSDKIFDYFSEPGYFHQLVNSRPCIIVGGRGTGKTTVLKSLSYEGQSRLNKESSPSEWNFYGLYWKVNLNRITSFVKRGLSDNEWQPYFIHYLNLILCHKLCQFAVWYEKTQDQKLNLDERLLRKAVTTLNIPIEYVQNIEDLEDEIDILIAELESKLNTISSDDKIFLTMLGAPIDRVSELLLQTTELNGKQFVFLIDEFENFEDYQQCIVNTLMKQINHLYTFKIGVRELGWRKRSTLRENEILNSPADYFKIDMRTVFQENSFSVFAKQVVESRLPELKKIGGIEKLLPSLVEEEEANILIGAEQEAQIRKNLASSLPKKYLKLLDQKSIGHIQFIDYMSRSREEPFIENLINWLENEGEWKDKFNNYFHAYLFSIRKGKSGIRKYYTGWDTFILLANNNIRYLIELVNKSIQIYLDNQSIAQIQYIDFDSQTKATQIIAKKNFTELEGISINGATLTKLLLGLGRLFEVLASNSEGHAPEVNQFYLNKTSEENQNVEAILTHAVMHLALIRIPGTKIGDITSTRDFDYMIHPIFAPFFVFSHRKKRKLALEATDIITLIDDPKKALKHLIQKNKRPAEVLQSSLPDQLDLFGEYLNVSN
ncbi:MULTISPECIES: ORC-CDC6 family AAA ATPase [Acinetobacter]|uniref:Uncharacterized protein n=8 Tax=Acinetobacter baumannii TaxID=470 RepID=A0A154DTS6_ACIBA|nr:MULTISPECIES: hypothetical protein [Acinetobacter]CAH1088783.1 Uncharacterised protein [Acinetobacter phage MD-2021a]ARG34095.1 hypothetical protein B7L46_03760 [Acinetobacter baumannii]AVN30573.1 hypothetical protein AM467_14495 [Acinetobacter baumannii]EHU1663751.1 hypothetical protein [Acinetobacter baumannii]EHU1782594.1 hypothetical protein [Acinetobacter baumannii]